MSRSSSINTFQNNYINEAGSIPSTRLQTCHYSLLIPKSPSYFHSIAVKLRQATEKIRQMQRPTLRYSNRKITHYPTPKRVRSPLTINYLLSKTTLFEFSHIPFSIDYLLFLAFWLAILRSPFQFISVLTFHYSILSSHASFRFPHLILTTSRRVTLMAWTEQLHTDKFKAKNCAALTCLKTEMRLKDETLRVSKILSRSSSNIWDLVISISQWHLKCLTLV